MAILFNSFLSHGNPLGKLELTFSLHSTYILRCGGKERKPAEGTLLWIPKGKKVVNLTRRRIHSEIVFCKSGSLQLP